MTTHLQFSILTLFPLSVLLIAVAVSVRRIRRLGEYRLLLLPAILVLMGQHQALEVLALVRGGTSVGFGPSEFIETGANVLASVAVYYGVDYAGEKHNLADRLAESEQRYRTLTEQSPLPVFVVQNGAITFANRAATSIFASDDADALVGRPLETLIGESVDSVPTTVEGFDDDDSVQMAQQEWIDLDGEDHTVVVSAGCANYRGSPAVYLICQDVTERERYRRSYERTRSQLESALQNSNDAILVIDPERDEILDANERAFEMLGYEREELLGLSPYEIHPHETDRLELFFERVTDESDLLTSELSCMRKDGRTIPAEISASTTEYGSRESVMAVVRDETERQQRQKQIEVLRRVLRHNLRNDMTVVVGLAQKIQAEGSGRVADFGRKIESTANDLLVLSESVRDIQSVVERDQLDPQQVDIPALVHDVAASMERAHPEATVRTDLPATVTIEGTEMLETALKELIENAINHSDSANPTVEIAVRENDSRRGDWVDLAVVDDGPGIPDNERSVVEMDAAESPLSHASGLGLWEVTQITTAFGGDVSISDNSNGGSTVTLHLKGVVASNPEPVPA
jgi:PAS domain S-box-containing protein